MTLPPRPAADAYAPLAASYDARYHAPHDEVEDEELRHLLQQYRGDGPILDVGCGTGFALSLLLTGDARHDAAILLRYTGVDPCPAMLAVAHSRFPGADFRLGDAETVALPAAHLVSLFGPYNYADPLRAWLNLDRLWPIGGTLLLLLYAHRVDTPRYILHASPPKMCRYSAKKLSRLIELIGGSGSVYGFGTPAFYASPRPVWPLLYPRTLSAVDDADACDFLIVMARRARSARPDLASHLNGLLTGSIGV